MSLCSRLLLVHPCGFFLGIELVVELEEALQDFFPGIGMDGVAGTVVRG